MAQGFMVGLIYMLLEIIYLKALLQILSLKLINSVIIHSFLGCLKKNILYFTLRIKACKKIGCMNINKKTNSYKQKQTQ